MILTRQILLNGRSDRNGYSSEQMRLFGADMTNKGWLRALIGKDFPAEVIEKFLALRNAHIDRKLPKNGKTFKYPSFQNVGTQLRHSEEYLHPNWQKMRLAILNRDNFACCDCGDKTKTLHVHHLKYIQGKFIWQVPHFYLVTLCEDCHSDEHKRDLTAARTLSAKYR